VVERGIATCRLAVRGKVAYVNVALGEEGAEITLGAVALEEMGLAVDPKRQELIPSPLWPLAAR